MKKVFAVLAASWCLWLVSPSTASAQHSCYRCANSQCTTTGGEGLPGQQYCFSDGNGVCQLSGDTCHFFTRPSLADTLKSTEVSRLAATGESLRRAANGRLFLRTSAGLVTFISKRIDGTLVLKTCTGGELVLADYVAAAQASEL